MQEFNYERRRQERAAEALPSTMMHRPLSATSILARAELLFATRQVISRSAPGQFQRRNYAELADDARRTGAALRRRGIRRGARVATLMWNHASHLAAYFGVPAIGAVLHPLNPRLSADELAYIVADAGDDAVLVDEDLLPLWMQVSRQVQVPHVIVNGDGEAARASGYPLLHQLLSTHEGSDLALDAPVEENAPVSICYTSGTTGRPRGVAYSHRSIFLQALALSAPDAVAVSGRDTLLVMAPMFHVNAWMIPFLAPMFGAQLVLPGARISSAEILDLLSAERVTAAFGVPTVWTDMLKVLDQEPGRWQLPPGLRVYSGGAQPPAALFRRLSALGASCQTGWGMTEVSSMASQSWLRSDAQHAGPESELKTLTSNGIALPIFDLRHVDTQGQPVVRDGIAFGELEVRGPSVTGNYIGLPANSALTPDGWLRTGDIVTIDPFGYVRLVDRLKDLVKSGGEWISSVELEKALEEHPGVAEAAVISMPDARWGERPLALVTCVPDWKFDAQALREHLAIRVPKWMVPEQILEEPHLPRTTVGKLDKAALRRRFASQ